MFFLIIINFVECLPIPDIEPYSTVLESNITVDLFKLDSILIDNLQGDQKVTDSGFKKLYKIC